MTEDKFLSPEEAMEILGVNEDKLLSLIDGGQLRAFRVDRKMQFKQSDVSALASGGLEAADDIVEELPDDIVMVAEGDADVEELEETSAGDATIVLNGSEDPATVFIEDEVEDAPEVLDESVGDERPTIVMDDSGVEELEEVSAEPEFMMDEELVEVSDEPEEEDATIVLEDEVSAVDEATTDVVFETPSNDGLGTEEIIFDDEDLAIGTADEEDVIGTQEMTVQEDAISEDDEATMLIDDGEAGDEYAPEGMEEDMPRASARSSAGSLRMRQAMTASPKVDPAWGITAILALTAACMLAPLMMYATVIWKGTTTSRETYASGELRHDGKLPEMGAVNVPGFLNDLVINNTWFGDTPDNWCGKPSGKAVSTNTPAPAPAADATEEKAEGETKKAAEADGEAAAE